MKNENITDFLESLTYKDGLITAVMQDYKTKEVLMLAHMNKEALRITIETGVMTYYSRKRQSLWVKGETSGNKQYVKNIFYDCDKDALLFIIEQTGQGACHTGHYSCFYSEYK